MKKYFLDQDDSGHWYLVESAHRADWESWLELDEDDKVSWDPPEFAIRIGGGPQQIDFDYNAEDLVL